MGHDACRPRRERSSGFTNFSDLIALQSGNVGADILGRTFPRGTVFDPATTRQLAAGQMDPVTGSWRRRAPASCATLSPATASRPAVSDAERAAG